MLLVLFLMPCSITFSFQQGAPLANTSPQKYEPFAQARAFIAEHFSRDQPLVMKHQGILSLVDFDVEPNPSAVVYTPAADTLHCGLYDSALGCDVNAPHNSLLMTL